MPASGDPLGVGVKLVTLTPANPSAAPRDPRGDALFDPATQAPEAIFDGTALTAHRTAAVSALATRHLARGDASRLVVFGAGVQATSHVEAMLAVRPVKRAGRLAVGRRAEALVAAGGRPVERRRRPGRRRRSRPRVHVHDDARAGVRRSGSCPGRPRERRRRVHARHAGARHETVARPGSSSRRARSRSPRPGIC